MKKLTGSQIRQTWIKFFESKGHKYMKGVSLIPQGDKSLLWVNAGVTGLKKYFDGSEIPPCRRIVNVQKSIRTNDIENVGHTARHHTFFEMLGNFSIGDYFRKEVIEWAYEILTSPKWFDLDKDKIYVTYNPTDLETFELWQKQGVDKSHLIPLEANYWQIGEGPCGPNTEVFFDRGEKYDPEHLGDKLLRDDLENDRYIEIWGIVFSQFNAVNGVPRSQYKELPSKNIDTGSGLERLACIMQGTETNFETDLFTPIINATEDICHKPYEGEYLMPYRVIADHARCLTFALSDGAIFSNEGRGYVLRRIIRRAMRYGQKLGINEPFMYKLVDVVVSSYKDFYPELEDKKEMVAKLIKGEEEKFIKTLSEGEALLYKFIEGKKELDAESSFKLYDTYGFPIDLTKEICLEKGVKVDIDGFDKLMEEQKERGRKARGEISSFHKQSKDLLQFKEASTFNYEKTSLVSKVNGLFKEGVKVDSIVDEGDVTFVETPFYAESGGQVSDTGTILSSSFEAKVVSVSKTPSGAHLHHIKVINGSVKVGDELTLSIDVDRRHLIERNHSATHLLHAAICEVLNEHVDQKGSYVDENYLRFDFAFNEKLEESKLKEIEALVNSKIEEGIEEKTLILPIEEASKLGAEMEFEEKYGDKVRVVTFSSFSKEFCGGTHVKNTADIGLFVIESEGASSSGVRRIQAYTSKSAFSYLLAKKELLSKIENSLGNIADKDIENKVNSLLNDNSSLMKENNSLKDKLSSLKAKSLDSNWSEVNGTMLFSKVIEGERNDLLTLGDNLKGKYPNYVIVLASSSKPKGALVIFAKGKLGANKVMKSIAPILAGNGGGKEEMASGSVSDLSRFDEAISKVKELINE